MKFNGLVKVAVLGLAVLLATGAFASSKGSLHVQEAVQVNGQQIQAGDYQLRWEGTGSNVEVSFMQGRKVITKTTARLIDLQSPSSRDAAVIDHTSGAASVSEVRFAGKRYALALGGGEKAALSGDNSTK